MPTKANRTEILMGVLALISILLIVLAREVLRQGGFPTGPYIVDLLICGVFAWDFAVRLSRSSDRTAFLRSNWHELPAMVPAVALYGVGIPLLAVALRLLRLIRFARVVLVPSRLRRSFNLADRFVQRSQLLFLGVLVTGIVVVAAISVLSIELRAPQSEMHGVADALWWALATVTTVGYGDIVPITPAGRAIGMVLMVVGIGFMAALVSQVSATIVETRLARTRMSHGHISDVEVARLQALIARLGDLTDGELAGLMREIVQLQCGIKH